ncbi:MULTISPECIES: hypothetical protein [Thermus]|uniref:Uncharacterized protein n=1 Tax=Thermus tengchongensis TaxID=1214928 RepID=A0A4Y9FA39_9DEIN|nr:MULTISPECIES: hypothetical protein [Thermus]TFU25413.1 hypothetical protein E0687_10830 [Thermus tengchongensis]
MPKPGFRKEVRRERLREVREVLLEELDRAAEEFRTLWRRAKASPEDEELLGELQVLVSVLAVKAKALEELLEEEALLTS